MATADVLFNIKTQTTDAVKNVNELSSKATALGKIMGGIALMKIGGDILSGLIKEIYAVGSAYETEFAMVETLLHGQEELAASLKNEVRDMGAAYGKSGTESAQAMYQLLSAGTDANSSMEMFEKNMRLSIAAGSDLTATIDLTTSVMNSYKFEAEDADMVMNNLIKTQNAGKTSVQALSESYGKVSAIAGPLNVDLNTLSAGFATLTLNGFNTAEAGTILKSMFNELGDSGSTVGKILKEETGMSFAELMESGKSLEDVLRILEKSAADDGLAMNELFGSVEAASGASVIASGNYEQFSGVLAQISSETDTVSLSFDKNSNTAEHNANVIKEKFNASLSETYDKIMDKMKPALEWLAENMDIIAPIVLVLVTVISTLIIVIGIYAIVTGIAAIAQSALFAPFIAIVGAIAILIAIIIMLVRSWDDIKAALGRVKESIAEFWEDVKSGVTDFWESVKQKFRAGIDNVKNAVRDFKDGITNAFEDMKNAIKNKVDWIQSKLEAFKNKVLSIKDGIVDGFKNMVSGIATGIQNGVDTLIAKVKNMVNSYMISPLNNAIGIINKIPKVNIPTIPSLAIGTNLVNADGLAYLHAGEAVVPAAHVAGGGFNAPREWNNKDAGNGQTVNIEKVEVKDPRNVKELVDSVMEEVANKLKGTPNYRKV